VACTALLFCPAIRVPFALRTVDTDRYAFSFCSDRINIKVTASGKIFVGATLRDAMGGMQRVAGGVKRWLRDALRTLQ
jgi:hypothetical protein